MSVYASRFRPLQKKKSKNDNITGTLQHVRDVRRPIGYAGGRDAGSDENEEIDADVAGQLKHPP